MAVLLSRVFWEDRREGRKRWAKGGVGGMMAGTRGLFQCPWHEGNTEIRESRKELRRERLTKENLKSRMCLSRAFVSGLKIYACVQEYKNINNTVSQKSSSSCACVVSVHCILLYLLKEIPQIRLGVFLLPKDSSSPRPGLSLGEQMFCSHLAIPHKAWWLGTLGPVWHTHQQRQVCTYTHILHPTPIITKTINPHRHILLHTP